MSVVVHEFPNGDVAIGIEHEGAFVPFASHSEGRFAQYVQRGQNLAERAEAGDELARDQIGKPLGSGESSSKELSGMTHDELDERASQLGVADFPSSGNKGEKIAAIEAHESNVSGEA